MITYERMAARFVVRGSWLWLKALALAVTNSSIKYKMCGKSQMSWQKGEQLEISKRLPRLAATATGAVAAAADVH